MRLDAFYMGINDVTTGEYCEFLNAALALKHVVVRDGGVYLDGGTDLLAETRAMSPYSRIGWDGQAFAVLDGKDNHPIVCIRWAGAAAYCNWLSAQKKLPPVLQHRHVGLRLQQERLSPADRGGVGVRGPRRSAASLPQLPVGR